MIVGRKLYVGAIAVNVLLLRLPPLLEKGGLLLSFLDDLITMNSSFLRTAKPCAVVSSSVMERESWKNE